MSHSIQFLFEHHCRCLLITVSPGSAWGDWANYTDSPLRAFENETGAPRNLVLAIRDALDVVETRVIYTVDR